MIFTIASIKGGTIRENQLVHEAVELLNHLINTQLFYREFMKMNMTNLRRKKGLEVVDQEDLTNQQIYDIIMSGEQLSDEEKDYEIDFEISYYTRPESSSRAMAHYKDNSVKLHREYWVNTALESACRLIFHEALHLQGFKHRDAFEHTSVPHSVGALVTRLVRNHKQELRAKKDYVPLFKCKFLSFIKVWKPVN